jgi:glycogen debranching enzyme
METSKIGLCVQSGNSYSHAIYASKEEVRKQILSKVRRELMTPRGLRTLTPTHPNYKGIYGGNQIERDLAYHQGSAFPWLLGFFAEAYLRIHGKGGLALIKNLYNGFEPK